MAPDWRTGEEMLATDRHQPARQVYRHGLQKKVNLVAGSKLRGVQQTESVLESNIAAAAEIDPRVSWIETQPVAFDLNTGRTYATKKIMVEQFAGTRYKPRAYTPDFRLRLDAGNEVYVEGKHTHLLEHAPETLDALSAVRQFGHRIILMTEEDFPSTLVRNLRLLKTANPSPPTAAECKRLSAELRTPTPASHLVENFGISTAVLFAWIRSGTLTCDLFERPLGAQTSLTYGAGCLDHLEVLPL